MKQECLSLTIIPTKAQSNQQIENDLLISYYTGLSRLENIILDADIKLFRSIPMCIILGVVLGVVMFLLK